MNAKKGGGEVLYIVIPAYNEEDNIQTVVDEWYDVAVRTGKDSRLVIVDDGSKDNTYQILMEMSKNKSQLIALTKPNSGHGATVLYAYRYALDAGADYIFQTDSDGQTVPEEFWAFWEKRASYDMIIGHRNHRQDGLSRIFVTKVLRFVVWLIFGENVPDANTPFRLMNSSVLKEILPLIPKDFNLSNVVLSVFYAKQDRNVLYLPITFRPRQGGVNSINLKRIFFIGVHALKDFAKINKGMMT